jgi:hypothetical protein
VCGAVLLDLHGIAVDFGLGARLDAVGGLRLLALQRLLGLGFLDGAICLGGELVGGNALVERQEVAVARRVRAAVVGAEMVSRLSLQQSAQSVAWCFVYATHIAGLGLQRVEVQAILHEPDERVRLDVLGEGQRVGVAHPAAGELQRGITEAGLL